MLAEIFTLSVSAILIENFVLVKFLGICPFFGVSKRVDTALGMGMSVLLIMVISSAVTWLANTFILIPMNMKYMQTMVFILIITVMVQFVEMVLKKMLPVLYKAIGTYLPLITANCAVLGASLLNIQREYSFVLAVVYGASAAIGFTLAIVLFAAVRERMELSNIPKPFRGLPILLIMAALMSMSFMGFQGLKLPV